MTTKRSFEIKRAIQNVIRKRNARSRMFIFNIREANILSLRYIEKMHTKWGDNKIISQMLLNEYLFYSNKIK